MTFNDAVEYVATITECSYNDADNDSLAYVTNNGW